MDQFSTKLNMISEYALGKLPRNLGNGAPSGQGRRNDWLCCTPSVGG